MEKLQRNPTKRKMQKTPRIRRRRATRLARQRMPWMKPSLLNIANTMEGSLMTKKEITISSELLLEFPLIPRNFL